MRFNQFIKSEGYSQEFIYNADETGLFYRSMPKYSLCSNLETKAIGFKEHKDRITVMVCPNADGSHKIIPMVIEKYAKPRPLKDLNKFPVIYKSQKTSWMNMEIFEDWYFNVFIESVKRHQKNTGHYGRVILLLNNAACHPKLS